MIVVLCGVLGGMILGFGIAVFMWSRRAVGTIVFHQENGSDEPPTMVAVLDEPVETIRGLEYAIFKISQK